MRPKILITAGNTWSPLDKVRVITNIFSGETGLRIAHQLAVIGFKVTLILGDHRVSIKPFRHKRLRIIKALTYDDVYRTIKKQVKKKKYTAMIHAAAISDYRLKTPNKKKLKSGKRRVLKLIPTQKIVNRIKVWHKQLLLIKFKLETVKSTKKLIKIALKSKTQSNADLVIANRPPRKGRHRFYLIKSKKRYLKINGKKNLAIKLGQIFQEELL